MGLYSDKSTTMSVDVHGSSRMAVEATDMDIIMEEMSVDKEGETYVVKYEDQILTHTTEEEFPEDVTSHTKEAAQDQVSYVCVFALLELILAISRNVHHLWSQYLCVCLSLSLNNKIFALVNGNTSAKV
jgi:hypothetical protein